MRQKPSTESSISNPSPGERGKHVYGRLIHYPHELNQAADTVSVAKTLDKLRQLSLVNELNKQRQEANDEFESNQIPPLNGEGGDGEPKLEADHRQRPQTSDSGKLIAS